MDGKVIWKFDGRAKIRLADGRLLKLNRQEFAELNHLMQWGDEVTLYHDDRTGKLRIRIKSEEIVLYPTPTPAIIKTPDKE